MSFPKFWELEMETQNGNSEVSREGLQTETSDFSFLNGSQPVGWVL